MSFSVICPKISLEQPQFEIAPGFILARATVKQAEQMQKLVGDAPLFGEPFQSYFECDLIETGEKGHLQISRRDPEYWHYHVVNFVGNDSKDLGVLGHVLHFKSIELFFGITIFDSGGWSYRPTKLMNTLTGLMRQTSFNFVHQVTSGDAAWITKWFHKVKAITEDKEMMAPLKRRQDLLYLPLDSDAHVLGLFSILEMLLTHQPSNKNLHDSLNHQVSTKMPLLNRKFETPTPHDDFFPNVPLDEVWKALYEYRSRIAHGNEYDFAKGPLAKLSDIALARGFLNDAVGKLLRLWIEEPDFIRDLKKC